MAGWVERHPSYPGANEEVQYFVNRAFEKLWHTLTPEKFQRFADLKALLSYLRLCTHSVVIDHARQHALLDEAPSEALLAGQAADISVEGDAIETPSNKRFGKAINQRLADEKEQAVVFGSFVLAMRSQRLHLRYSHLFNDVKDVYRTKQNVLERLRHSGSRSCSFPR